MKLTIDPTPYRFNGKEKFKIVKAPTKRSRRLYESDEDLKSKLAAYQDEIDELQQKMFAEDRQGMLMIFQAMDAAGKDGTIRNVMSGINPGGVEVQNFKRPSDEELDHDYLWRCMKVATPRGRLGIFNRSYYEEVLICKVHPEIVTKYQRLPLESTDKMGKLFDQRYEDISNYETYLSRNGIQVVKFFLNVSKAEQKKRFLERIETPNKNWKFNAADVKERTFWNKYMEAYEDAINRTATKSCPWYAIPADDKGDMRLLVSAAILSHLKAMNLKWPTLPEEQVAGLATAKAALLAEK
jgi:PPK2 family polyphosphate:nucleotide phosphotransferase